jgi:hypothetical protein
MCTAVGHVLVFRVSTIPRMGFISRLAIAVLKRLEVISKTAAPVVSEPVPAVVGTVEKVSERLEASKRGLTCYQWSELLGDRQALAWSIISVAVRATNKTIDEPIGALMKSIRSASL